MKRRVCSILTLALLVTSAGAVLAEHHETKMMGTFVWERSDDGTPGDLEAVFTPGEREGVWDVVFHFEWEGEMRAWKGEARGSLTKGQLEGQAIEDRGRERTFMFKGEFADGMFTGTHGRSRDGEFRKSGTITLKGE